MSTFRRPSNISWKFTFLVTNFSKFWGNFAILAKIARFQAHFSEFKQVLAIFSKFATFNYVKLDIKLHFKRGYKHKIQNFWKICYFAHSSYIINATLCSDRFRSCSDHFLIVFRSFSNRSAFQKLEPDLIVYQSFADLFFRSFPIIFRLFPIIFQSVSDHFSIISNLFDI